jgi:hypothetical protein
MYERWKLSLFGEIEINFYFWVVLSGGGDKRLFDLGTG